MSDWLKDELTRHLGPIRAPDGLWERIQNAGQAGSLPHSPWMGWAVAAVVTLATAVGGYWLPRPQMRVDVAVSPVSERADSRRHQPAQWDLQCAPATSRASFPVAGRAVRRGHPLAVAGLSCQACHSTGLNQHHL